MYYYIYAVKILLQLLYTITIFNLYTFTTLFFDQKGGLLPPQSQLKNNIP